MCSYICLTGSGRNIARSGKFWDSYKDKHLKLFNDSGGSTDPDLRDVGKLYRATWCYNQNTAVFLRTLLHTVSYRVVGLSFSDFKIKAGVIL
jgi:hypothetical protein